MPEAGLRRYGRRNQLGLSAEPLRSKWVLPCCKTFADDGASYSQIASAGSEIFVKMYGRKHSDNLDYLRYIKYMVYAATSTKTLQPATLSNRKSSLLSQPTCLPPSYDIEEFRSVPV